jgi:hypothetical protein
MPDEHVDGLRKIVTVLEFAKVSSEHGHMIEIGIKFRRSSQAVLTIRVVREYKDGILLLLC